MIQRSRNIQREPLQARIDRSLEWASRMYEPITTADSGSPTFNCLRCSDCLCMSVGDTTVPSSIQLNLQCYNSPISFPCQSITQHKVTRSRQHHIFFAARRTSPSLPSTITPKITSRSSLLRNTLSLIPIGGARPRRVCFRHLHPTCTPRRTPSTFFSFQTPSTFPSFTNPSTSHYVTDANEFNHKVLTAMAPNCAP